MNHEQIISQLGIFGAILVGVIYLLREIRKLQPPMPAPASKVSGSIHPTSNGRVQRLEDRTEHRFERIETKIENQSEQLDALSRAHHETLLVIERINGKLDVVLEQTKGSK